jgi:hypothetical protein
LAIFSIVRVHQSLENPGRQRQQVSIGPAFLQMTWLCKT